MSKLKPLIPCPSSNLSWSISQLGFTWETCAVYSHYPASSAFFLKPLCPSLCLVRLSSLMFDLREQVEVGEYQQRDHCSCNLAGAAFLSRQWVLQLHCSLLGWSTCLANPSGTTPELLTLLMIQVTVSFEATLLSRIPLQHLKPGSS